ncbi:alanine racemase [Patescibacteria group bacterium]|nr:alanine racemase [Patescibacteria group bacterium]MDE1946551.1 alanine racemase [Patescibacteria group bacterium]MDE2010888.1 alanine racemase [Patescibacteria group bacterium]MDE2232772.1 alanine racemase [Patescibacteria group bacterium]
MKRWLTRLSKSRFPYEPLITVEISRGRLLNNLNQFKKLAPNGNIAPVLKSNAYGHGLIEVAEILESEKAPFFVIDSYFEAVALRARGINTPLLVIGYTRPETIANSRLKNISFAVTSIETLRSLRELTSDRNCTCNKFSFFRRRSAIHLKIDTGMRRQGILPEEVAETMHIIKSNPRIIIEGIASHLPDADNSDQSFTLNQIALWNDIVDRFTAAFPELKYIHLANTDGHRFHGKIKANISRLGIGLYGLSDNNPFSAEKSPALDIQPVMELKTIITGVKTLKKGESAGYSRTFTALNEMRIATVPAGYFEGVDRRLSNNGSMLICEKRVPCPIIGRVSMNISTVDVSGVTDAKIGTPVIVFSRGTSDLNSIRNAAALCGTIPYEIAVKIPTHLKRTIVE